LQVSTWVNNWCWRHGSSTCTSGRCSGSTAGAASGFAASVASGVTTVLAFVLENTAQQTELVTTATTRIAAGNGFASAGRSSAATLVSFASAAGFCTASWFASRSAAVARRLVALQVSQQAVFLVLSCTEQFQQGLTTWLAASVFNAAARTSATSVFDTAARTSTAGIFDAAAGASATSIFNAAGRTSAAAFAASWCTCVFYTAARTSGIASVTASAVTSAALQAEHTIEQSTSKAGGTEASAQYQRSNKNVPLHRVTTPKR